MKQSIKLFNFQGTPVILSIWFLLIFILSSISFGVSIFIAVLIHELAHAWVANIKGYRVYSINIDLLSGSAVIDNNMHEKDSIPITAAGPISNLLLTFIGYIALSLFPDVIFISDFIKVNLLLFIFNILPIYPMDGGRIFKDFLILKMRSRYKANRISGLTSLITSTILLVFSLFTVNFIMILFSGYFCYLSLKGLKLINI
jgi:stage IV sporulation protein FB